MNEEILFQYQVKTKSQYGTRFYYFYADTDIENYLNNKNIKYVRYAKDTVLNKKEKRIRELFKENKQLQQENERLKNNNKILVTQKEEAYKIANKEYEENQSLKDRMKMINELLKQHTPTYASCVKLLDEIELFAKGDK